MTPGGAGYALFGPLVAGKVGKANGAITGAADAGRESALAIGIMGGSYAVEVFIRLRDGGGAGFADNVLAADGRAYGEAAVITGAAGL